MKGADNIVWGEDCLDSLNNGKRKQKWGGPREGVKSRVDQPKAKCVLMYQHFHTHYHLKAPLLPASYHRIDKALAPYFVVDMADNSAPLSRARAFLTTPLRHFDPSCSAFERNVQYAY
jgi:hypothetical protein